MVLLTILWPAHRLTRAQQSTTTGRIIAAIRTDNARYTQGRCVAVVVALDSGYEKGGGGTCECGAAARSSDLSAETGGGCNAWRFA